MRDIKFRGVTAKGSMVFGYLVNDKEGSTNYWNEYSKRICWYLEEGGSANAPVKNGTVGQFTGLHDKNGVEIYEDDIVKPLSKGWCGDFLTGVITYKGGSFAPESKGISWSFNGINCEYHEVIGNIHENPELLGEE